MTENNSSEYIPGTCNIGPDEIRLRRNNAILMASISVLLVAVFVLFPIPKIFRLILFLPLTGFAIGIQQWYFKFCVYLGTKGLYNFEESGKRFTVVQEEMRKLDKQRAQRIILTSIGISSILAISFFFLP